MPYLHSWVYFVLLLIFGRIIDVILDIHDNDDR
jgi:hypothetical protein